MKIFSNLQFSICNFQFAIILLIFFSPAAIFAHSMDVFATVEGKSIQGHAEYHDGAPAKNCEVKAFDTAGEEIGRTKTDAAGKFTLEARFRCDYRLLVDAGDGHGGEYTISANTLPSVLPPRNQTDTDHNEENHLETDHIHNPSAEADHDEAHFKDLHAQIVALQNQLSDYEQRRRFRDILGGIGFIVGIVGAAYGYYYRGLLYKARQTGQ